MARANRRGHAGLSTPFGKRLGKITYKQLGSTIASLIVVCAIYFCVSTPFYQGTNKESISFLNSLYFSVITFTSLGYGDISPVGFGKVVASVEVLLGLVSVALFVGKLASERQSAMLLLLYTSEQQRRLQEFTQGLNTMTDVISEKLKNHDHEGLKDAGERSLAFLSSISNFLVFQANQGGLANFGNDTALRMIYGAIYSMQSKSVAILKIKETKQSYRNTFVQISSRAQDVASKMSAFHKNDETTLGILLEIQVQDEHYRKWNESVQTGDVEMKHNTSITEALLNSVAEFMPLPPWPKDITKELAKDLSMTISLATKCVGILINRGTWPNLPKQTPQNSTSEETNET